jgi:hypothetical protein
VGLHIYLRLDLKIGSEKAREWVLFSFTLEWRMKMHYRLFVSFVDRDGKDVFIKLDNNLKRLLEFVADLDAEQVVINSIQIVPNN